MLKKMLIEAAHSEEVRIAIIDDNNRLEEFDFENATKKTLKGNIYLAKVMRVEPSLQAAFVDYGGNRHGFLPFSEIHPDYFRIPVGDREALEAEMMEFAKKQEELAEQADLEAEEKAKESKESLAVSSTEIKEEKETEETEEAAQEEGKATKNVRNRRRRSKSAKTQEAEESISTEPDDTKKNNSREETHELKHVQEVVTVGGEAPEDIRDEHAADKPMSFHRRYKIQEVVQRNQIVLVQITKEERGAKGAAMTSYLSLAGRCCVLMPNSPRGGGVSRKIASLQDRKRLREILNDIDVPESMSLIIRTAGKDRTKVEIKRDSDYLIRLWENIRSHTLESTAPALIYEEADIIRRAIRDMFSKDIEQVIVEGEDAFKAARSFMKELVPSSIKKVSEYKEANTSIFQKYGVSTQIDQLLMPTAPLPSGGSIVINQTEALVAIDINSGRSTRERHISNTALKTNIEATKEIARQLRLRDLAGLIVIDFIDMDDSRHNRQVENHLRQAMSPDRARIQIGHISPFGLLELSRQRLRPSIFESSSVPCEHCGGSGMRRSLESSALEFLRALEESASNKRSSHIRAKAPEDIVLYILNHKRNHITEIESKHSVQLEISCDMTMQRPHFDIAFEAVGTDQTQKQQSRHKQKRRPVQKTEVAENQDSTQVEGQQRADQGGGRRRERRSNRSRRVQQGQDKEKAKDDSNTIVIPIVRDQKDEQKSWWKRLLD
jgi:ribonuclease E